MGFLTRTRFALARDMLIINLSTRYSKVSESADRRWPLLTLGSESCRRLLSNEMASMSWGCGEGAGSWQGKLWEWSDGVVGRPGCFIDGLQDDILASSRGECFQGTEPRPAINLSGETSLWNTSELTKQMSAGRGSPAHLILYRKHVIKGGWRPMSSLHPLCDRVRTTVMLNVIFTIQDCGFLDGSHSGFSHWLGIWP